MRPVTVFGAALALAMGAGLLAGASADAAEWTKQFPKFRYGVQPVETLAASQARYKGFGEYLKKKFGVELELFLAADYAGVIRALGSKQIEVMDMGAAGYAAAWIDTKGAVEPLVVPTNPDGTIGYYAVAIVRADSPYKSVQDLRGKSWAWVDQNSSSGYLFPQVSFRKMGLDPATHFGKVVFSGGHEQGVIGVLDKTYDAAVTWTNDIEKHTRGGLQMLLSRGVLKKEDIRIIWVSDLIPNPVITTRSDIPKEMKDDLKAMFLNLHNDDSQVFHAVARGESRGYVEVKHDVYQIAVDLRNQLTREQRGR
jgi:phosphonate transport system substrate-binding protein